MKKLLVLILIVLLQSNCAGSKTIVTETKSKVEIITEITEKKLDTTLVIPEENAELFIPFSKFIDKKGNVKPEAFKQQFQSKKGRATASAKINKSGIVFRSKCDSILERLQFYEKKFKETKKEDTDTKTKVKEKTGYSLTELILYMIATFAVAFTAGYLTKTFKIL